MPDVERVLNAPPSQETPNVGSVEVRAEEESRVAMERNETQVSNAPVAQSSARFASSTAANTPQSSMMKNVEDILSDGLREVYLALPADRKQAFKQKGEAVARTITDMILHGVAKVKAVWRLLREWLGSLPGMNKYFLEQEIKIKTDRVMMLAESAHT